MTRVERLRDLWQFVSEHPGRTAWAYAVPLGVFQEDLEELVNYGWLKTYEAANGTVRYMARVPLISISPQEGPKTGR